MNIYGFFAGGTDLANTGVVANAEILAWLTALSQAMVANTDYDMHRGYMPDDAAADMEGLYITVETPVRVTLPADVIGTAGILRSWEVYTDDSCTDVITSEDTGYPVRGDIVFVIHTDSFTKDIEVLQKALLSDGVLFQGGQGSSSLNGVYTPFDGAKASVFYKKAGIAALKKRVAAKMAVQAAPASVMVTN